MHYNKFDPKYTLTLTQGTRLQDIINKVHPSPENICNNAS